MISQLRCYQQKIGGRQLSCFWIAAPEASFYELVYTNLEGSKNLVMNVSELFANVELKTVMGNVIKVSVNDASTKIMLMSTSLINFFTTFAFIGFSLLPCYDDS